jgi:hypothetical protein
MHTDYSFVLYHTALSTHKNGHLVDRTTQAYNWRRRLAQRINKKPAGTTRASGGLSPD